MNTLNLIIDYASGIASVIGLVSILVKPIRNRLFGIKRIEEGQKCLLRSQILAIYYAHQDDKTLRQFERENLDYLYNAYDALKGNSFVKDIYKAMRTWEVIQ